MNKQPRTLPLGFSWEPTPIFLPREDKLGEALFIFQKNMEYLTPQEH